MSPKIVRFLTVCMLFGLVACEDKEMVAKSQEQSKRIEALRAELAVQKVKLDANWAKDPTDELEQTESEIEEVKDNLVDLERELKQIEKDREETQEAFDEYKKKYPIGL